MNINFEDQQIQNARLVAHTAHAAVGQKRKHSGIDYINHPADVVKILREHSTILTHRMVMAAWMHDVVEDTKIDIDFIYDKFGTAVSRMVFGLTNEKPHGMNRAERHAHNIARLKNTARDVKTIKLADCIANMRDIVREDPKFAATYLAEKRILINSALQDGCPVLWEMADTIIKNFEVESRAFNCETA
jgi:(p)ppGpp synthase/HD superfamily hydrolase